MADQGSEGLLSPYLRNKRLQAVKPFLQGRVLDFGCGSGQLAQFVASDKYFGVDIDPISLEGAKQTYPEHAFSAMLLDKSNKFETIVSLAVIEHVDCPVAFLKSLMKHLDNLPSSRVVITTPHPSVEWVHNIGAAIGLFSKHANEEHKELLDLKKLGGIGKNVGLELESYTRFLFGANQIAIFRPMN